MRPGHRSRRPAGPASRCPTTTSGGVSLRSEFCCPSPGPGGSDQYEKTDDAVGASAFGTFSGSVNGERISGLVGNTSVKKTASPRAVDVAAKAPLGDRRPRRAIDGTHRSRAPMTAAPVTTPAPTRRTVRRWRLESWAVGTSGSVTCCCSGSWAVWSGRSVSSVIARLSSEGPPRKGPSYPKLATPPGSRCVCPLSGHRDLGQTLWARRAPATAFGLVSRPRAGGSRRCTGGPPVVGHSNPGVLPGFSQMYRWS